MWVTWISWGAASLALVTLLYWFYMLYEVTNGLPAIEPLPAATDEPGSGDLPLVSIIVAAKEEESSIAETVRRLEAQSYPKIEIIAVNDRSTDTTGLKLNELKKWTEQKESTGLRMRIIHITSLPKGWIGKNHALYQGYLQAKGKYLLFADADVNLQPDAIRDAVAYMQQHETDHLTLAPTIKTGDWMLKQFVSFFFFTFFMFFRPWRANRDKQRRFGIGIGAFNLIRRDAYERIGTHRAFAMRPDDDLQLGMQVKRSGLRQRFLLGLDSAEVEWYPNISKAITGLEKNLFSGFDYRLGYALLGILLQLLFFVFPFAGIWIAYWFGGPWVSAAYLASIAIMLSLYAVFIRKLSRSSGIEAPFLPLAALVMAYTFIRAVFLTLRRGGITWRGTFYSLEELKFLSKKW
ncbi:glycosyltransferase [Paenibacillus sp. y28]|uniref:glycosyltransferase n=1 Tax=Paenibacillus sp. y28 TaxID=3129110 RepID=UPI00301659F1